MYEIMLCLMAFLCLVLAAGFITLAHAGNLLVERLKQLRTENRRLQETINGMQAPTNYGKPNDHT